MTGPSQFGDSADRTPPPPPAQSEGYRPPYPPPYPPPPGQYPPPVGQYPHPGQYPSAYVDPAAPYGRHPLTGEPLSDKSKVVAALLQLIGLLGFLGFGRMYLGQVGLGIAQLLIGLIGGFVIGILTCGLGFAIPVIWGIIDAILILTDKVRDPAGRPLRDGT